MWGKIELQIVFRWSPCMYYVLWVLFWVQVTYLVLGVLGIFEFLENHKFSKMQVNAFLAKKRQVAINLPSPSLTVSSFINHFQEGPFITQFFTKWKLMSKDFFCVLQSSASLELLVLLPINAIISSLWASKIFGKTFRRRKCGTKKCKDFGFTETWTMSLMTVFNPHCTWRFTLGFPFMPLCSSSSNEPVISSSSVRFKLPFSPLDGRRMAKNSVSSCKRPLGILVAPNSWVMGRRAEPARFPLLSLLSPTPTRQTLPHSTSIFSKRYYRRQLHL